MSFLLDSGLSFRDLQQGGSGSNWARDTETVTLDSESPAGAPSWYKLRTEWDGHGVSVLSGSAPDLSWYHLHHEPESIQCHTQNASVSIPVSFKDLKKSSNSCSTSSPKIERLQDAVGDELGNNEKPDAALSEGARGADILSTPLSTDKLSVPQLWLLSKLNLKQFSLTDSSAAIMTAL